MKDTQPQSTKAAIYGVIVVLVVLIILAGLIMFFFKSGNVRQANPNIEPIPDTRVLNSAVYGFEITAPAGVDAETSFKQYYALSNRWRAGAPAEGEGSQGTPVLALPIIRMDNQNVTSTSSDSSSTSTPRKIYPLYFDVEVRIGVSSSTGSCLKPDADFPGQKGVDITIGGYPFKKFTFSDAAMMQYVSGQSYRAVRNGLCYAIEEVKTGSSYREANMEEALSDKDMDAYFAQADEALKTFKFTK